MPPTVLARLLFACVAFTLLLATLPASAEGPRVGAPAPDFRLQDQNGRWVTLEEQRGRWLVL